MPRPRQRVVDPVARQLERSAAASRLPATWRGREGGRAGCPFRASAVLTASRQTRAIDINHRPDTPPQHTATCTRALCARLARWRVFPHPSHAHTCGSNLAPLTKPTQTLVPEPGTPSLQGHHPPPPPPCESCKTTSLSRQLPRPRDARDVREFVGSHDPAWAHLAVRPLHPSSLTPTAGNEPSSSSSSSSLPTTRHPR